MTNSVHVILILCLQFILCNYRINKLAKVNPSDFSQNGKSFLEHEDTIQKVSVFPYHEDLTLTNTHQQFLHNLAKIIGLPSLYKGNIGLNIRIWLNADSSSYIINISDNKLNKECSIIEWGSKKVDSTEYVVVKKEWKYLIPKLGWEDFFVNLKKYKILGMKGGKPFIQQKELLTQMDYVQFEIAQADHYYFYEYLEPSFYRYVDMESHNVFSFLEYFNQVMNVRVYNPEKSLFVKP